MDIMFYSAKAEMLFDIIVHYTDSDIHLFGVNICHSLYTKPRALRVLCKDLLQYKPDICAVIVTYVQVECKLPRLLVS